MGKIPTCWSTSDPPPHKTSPYFERVTLLQASLIYHLLVQQEIMKYCCFFSRPEMVSQCQVLCIHFVLRFWHMLVVVLIPNSIIKNRIPLEGPFFRTHQLIPWSPCHPSIPWRPCHQNVILKKKSCFFNLSIFFHAASFVTTTNM